MQDLQEELKSVKSTNNESFRRNIVPKIIELGVTDSPPIRRPPVPKKTKGKKPAPRLPYKTYISADGIEIRVGRGAEDNDELSCNSKYRDNGKLT